MRVELDKKSLFALASDTRLEILRALEPSRRTLSQLAEALNADKAGIHRHLKKLEEGGFVKRFEDHGFVYYGLSWKARDILSPNENTKIVIVLSCSWILILAAAAFLFLGFFAQAGFGAGGASEVNQSDAYRDLFSPVGSGLPLWLLVGLAFAVVGVALVFMAARGLRRPKQAFPPPEKEAESIGQALTP